MIHASVELIEAMRGECPWANVADIYNSSRGLMAARTREVEREINDERRSA